MKSMADSPTFTSLGSNFGGILIYKRAADHAQKARFEGIQPDDRDTRSERNRSRNAQIASIPKTSNFKKIFTIILFKKNLLINNTH